MPVGPPPAGWAGAAPPTADAVLAALDPEQRAVATGPRAARSASWPGAGTGKTRAITHRIAYGVHAGVYTPQRCSRSPSRPGRPARCAAGCARWASAASRPARSTRPRCASCATSGRASSAARCPRITDRKVPLLAEAAGRLPASRPGRPGARPRRRGRVGQGHAHVARGLPAPRRLRAGRTPPLDLDAATMGRVFAGYEEAKRAKGFIDFEDVLLLTVGCLEDRRDVADEVRGAYRHFVVDEYQDVNPLQQRLLELWLGDRDALCVVGDASQTIYSFTGASSSYLLDFARR